MDLDEALRLLAEDPDAPVDVAEAVLHLARDEYPRLDAEAYRGELDAMAREARGYVRGDFDARVGGLCRYLFHEMGFRGNARDYYDPRNSYLNEVLDRRTGIPITLSVVTMAVGARVGLDVVGIGLPGHFVVKVVGEGQEVFIDPFHGGRRLAATDCENLVRHATGEAFVATPQSLRAVTPAQLLIRLLTNLKFIYLRREDFPRAVRVLRRLLQVSPCDPVQRRDLGMCLVRAGCPGQAINHLEAYLKALPRKGDWGEVKDLLTQALGEVARWN